MANTSANVLAGKPLVTGGVLAGPIGTTLPTDATTAPDAAFVATGYISEDGLTETTDRTTEKIKAWGGDVVKVVQSEFAVTYSFAFIESLNADVLGTVYGDANVTTTPGDPTNGTLYSVSINAEQLPRKEWLFEMKDGDARIRIVLPNAQVTTVGEITYTDSAVISYQVTIEAFPDDSGNQAYKYLNDGVLIPV